MLRETCHEAQRAGVTAIGITIVELSSGRPSTQLECPLAP